MGKDACKSPVKKYQALPEGCFSPVGNGSAGQVRSAAPDEVPPVQRETAGAAHGKGFRTVSSE